ncbi:MAG: Glu-tRNA(Gln) amidotransferase GatDE subunit E [Thaumarchaeota archaeon S13]|nr:MAG: Glu-tRNA(Gln) amidotransferase GatDE subunit E [Thaumarchaeota archaeon S13]
MSAPAGLLVGLEVHQQLDTGRKLFCACEPVESDEHASTFTRRLRAAASETGTYDRAAVFEGARAREFTYVASPQSSCALERDEMPPRGLDPAAKGIALTVAAALGSTPFAELLPMRKMVIDGSNTSGFQRTMLVASGGELDAGGTRVGVQSICLEEDAATYSLDRLGVPLVEIALAPVATDGAGARAVALALGRLLRSTRSVRRGLGSIRQDVNVSLGGGAIVEVKGVQQLDQLERVVEHEAQRHAALAELAARPEVSGMPEITDEDTAEVTGLLEGTASPVLGKALSRGESVVCVRARGMAGMLSLEPRAGFRLGRELAGAVRPLGIRGVFHSDELPAHGITAAEVASIRDMLGLREGDAFVMAAAPEDVAAHALRALRDRLNAARHGAPAETRMATPDGRTEYLRPRPGAARMYPETDVPPIRIAQEELDAAAKSVPRTWDEELAELRSRHGLNAQLAEQLLDSERLAAFERAVSHPSIEANFAASVLLSTITALRRKGLVSPLPDSEIDAAFAMLSRGEIAKESMEMIFEAIMSGRASTAAECAAGAGVSSDELDSTLERIVEENAGAIREQGERAMGLLMGKAMRELRGRVPGEEVSAALARLIASAAKRPK